LEQLINIILSVFASSNYAAHVNHCLVAWNLQKRTLFIMLNHATSYHAMYLKRTAALCIICCHLKPHLQPKKPVKKGHACLLDFGEKVHFATIPIHTFMSHALYLSTEDL
jgi:hypothetical protein